MHTNTPATANIVSLNVYQLPNGKCVVREDDTVLLDNVNISEGKYFCQGYLYAMAEAAADGIVRTCDVYDQDFVISETISSASIKPQEVE